MKKKNMFIALVIAIAAGPLWSRLFPSNGSSKPNLWQNKLYKLSKKGKRRLFQRVGKIRISAGWRILEIGVYQGRSGGATAFLRGIVATALVSI